MSQGRTPLWANSTMRWRTTSGRGRPFTKTPPNWFTPPWPKMQIIMYLISDRNWKNLKSCFPMWLQIRSTSFGYFWWFLLGHLDHWWWTNDIIIISVKCCTFAPDVNIKILKVKVVKMETPALRLHEPILKTCWDMFCNIKLFILI